MSIFHIGFFEESSIITIISIVKFQIIKLRTGR